MTIDDLAAAVQQEFRVIHEGMATKEGLEALRDDVDTLRQDASILQRDMTEGFRGTTAVLKQIHEELKDLKGMDAELTALRIRLARVEKKVGLA